MTRQRDAKVHALYNPTTVPRSIRVGASSPKTTRTPTMLRRRTASRRHQRNFAPLVRSPSTPSSAARNADAVGEPASPTLAGRIKRPDADAHPRPLHALAFERPTVDVGASTSSPARNARREPDLLMQNDSRRPAPLSEGAKRTRVENTGDPHVHRTRAAPLVATAERHHVRPSSVRSATPSEYRVHTGDPASALPHHVTSRASANTVKASAKDTRRVGSERPASSDANRVSHRDEGFGASVSTDSITPQPDAGSTNTLQDASDSGGNANQKPELTGVERAWGPEIAASLRPDYSRYVGAAHVHGRTPAVRRRARANRSREDENDELDFARTLVINGIEDGDEPEEIARRIGAAETGRTAALVDKLLRANEQEDERRRHSARSSCTQARSSTGSNTNADGVLAAPGQPNGENAHAQAHASRGRFGENWQTQPSAQESTRAPEGSSAVRQHKNLRPGRTGDVRAHTDIGTQEPHPARVITIVAEDVRSRISADDLCTDVEQLVQTAFALEALAIEVGDYDELLGTVTSAKEGVRVAQTNATEAQRRYEAARELVAAQSANARHRRTPDHHFASDSSRIDTAERSAEAGGGERVSRRQGAFHYFSAAPARGNTGSPLHNGTYGSVLRRAESAGVQEDSNHGKSGSFRKFYERRIHSFLPASGSTANTALQRADSDSHRNPADMAAVSGPGERHGNSNRDAPGTSPHADPRASKSAARHSTGGPSSGHVETGEQQRLERSQRLRVGEEHVLHLTGAAGHADSSLPRSQPNGASALDHHRVTVPQTQHAGHGGEHREGAAHRVQPHEERTVRRMPSSGLRRLASASGALVRRVRSKSKNAASVEPNAAPGHGRDAPSGTSRGLNGPVGKDEVGSSRALGGLASLIRPMSVSSAGSSSIVGSSRPQSSSSWRSSFLRHTGDSSGTSTSGVVLEERILQALEICPDEILAEVRIDANRTRRELAAALETLMHAQAAFDKRQALDERRLNLLDRFYGRVRGWQEDVVSRKLFQEVGDMSEWAIDAENELAELFHEREIMYAALDDHRKCQEFISEASSLLKSILHELDVAKTANTVDLLRNGGAAKTAAVEVHDRLKAAKIGAAQARAKIKLAAISCSDMPRVNKIAVSTSELLSCVDIGFDSMAVDLVTRDAVVNALRRARLASSDCDACVFWVRRRIALIEDDLENNESTVEHREQTVMEERMALLRQRHEKDPTFRLDDDDDDDDDDVISEEDANENAREDAADPALALRSTVRAQATRSRSTISI